MKSIKQHPSFNLKAKSFKGTVNLNLENKIKQGKIKFISQDYIETANTVIGKDLYFTMHGNQVMLKRPDSSWEHPDAKYHNALILSPDNSKVNNAARCHFDKRWDKDTHPKDKNALCYGKPSIISCPFASNCVQFCYADAVESNYVASLRIHGHNYWMVYGQRWDVILERIENGYDIAGAQFHLIRLNDCGDFISKHEIIAWAKFAAAHPDVMVYGYTKNAAHYYKALEFLGGILPDNFRVNISSTAQNDATTDKYIGILRAEYPEHTVVCEIIDTWARYWKFYNLPWNNEEFQAISHNRDFKILLHSTNFVQGSEQYELNKLYMYYHDRVSAFKVC